jgi:hypothetical protein
VLHNGSAGFFWRLNSASEPGAIERPKGTQIGFSRFIYVKSRTVMSNKPQTVTAGRPTDVFQAHKIAIDLSKKLDASIRYRAGKEGA